MAFFPRNRYILLIYSIAFTCFLFTPALPIYYAVCSSSSSSSLPSVQEHQVSFFERCLLNTSISSNHRITSSSCMFLSLENAECSTSKIIDTIGKVASIGAIIFSGFCLLTHIAVDDMMKRNIRDVYGVPPSAGKTKENTNNNNVEEGKKNDAHDDRDNKNHYHYQPLRAGCVSSSILSLVFGLILVIMGVVGFVVKCDENKYKETSRTLAVGLFVAIAALVFSIAGAVMVLASNWGKGLPDGREGDLLVKGRKTGEEKKKGEIVKEEGEKSPNKKED